MLHQEFDPPAALRDAVKCFWYNRRDGGASPAPVEVLPDGYAEIIFYFGAPCVVACAGERRRLPSPFLVGLLDAPLLVDAGSRLEIIGVRCFPWAVVELLGLPAGSDGVQAIEHPIARLQAALAECVEAGRVDLALAELERGLLAAWPALALDAAVSRAGAAMRAAHGGLPVSQLAVAAHATVRTLERKFKQSSGHTLKDVSSVTRFEQARNRLWTAPDVNLAELAQALGYADQSHLNREFKRYSGMTPAAFLRKRREGGGR